MCCVQTLWWCCLWCSLNVLFVFGSLAVMYWEILWKGAVLSVPGSSPWPQASVNPLWGWTNTPHYLKNSRDTWRCVCHWIAIFLQLLCLAFFVKCTTCLPFLGESPRQTRHPEVHVVFQKSVGKLNSLPLQTDTTRNQTFYEMKWFKKRFWNSRLSLSRQAQCQEVRKRKELELQILTESIRLWEGDDIKTLGSVIYMSQVLVQSQLSEVFIWLLHLYFALL